MVLSYGSHFDCVADSMESAVVRWLDGDSGMTTSSSAAGLISAVG